MAKAGNITVPVTLDITTYMDGKPVTITDNLDHNPTPAGNTNPSLTVVAAAMNGLSLEEFSLLGHWEQSEYRTLAHNLLQVYAVTPR